jgi:hypothetical protein
VKASLFTLKRRGVRFLGVLALCATATAVPLALGSGSPAGAIVPGGCTGQPHYYGAIVPRFHPDEECV